MALEKPDADVRMRGFRQRATVMDAQQWVDSHSDALPSEPVPLAELCGRVLAEPIVSRVNVPSFDRAMMDGYAVRADETGGATAYNQLVFKVIGQSLPGGPFEGELQLGQCIRIMTGAPMPQGADAVLPAERCEVSPDSPDHVQIQGDVPPGKHVGRIGEDIQVDQTVLSAGRRLRPQDIGVLSSIGRAEAAVVMQPTVKLVITGDELLPPGATPTGPKIADANGPMLAALVRRDGGLVQSDGITPDEPDAIRDAMVCDADVVLVSGGSSVGQEDHAPVLLSQHGQLAVHGVTMRPSSPAGMGTLPRAGASDASDASSVPSTRPTLVFLLPGNPVSCLCAYDFFAGRAIRRLGGRKQQWPYPVTRGTLSRKLVSVVGRTDYARVRWQSSGQVEPLAVSGASVLSSTTRADGFVVVGPDSEGFAAGSEVTVYLYDGTSLPTAPVTKSKISSSMLSIGTRRNAGSTRTWT